MNRGAFSPLEPDNKRTGTSGVKQRPLRGSPPPLARIASRGCWRGDAAVRRVVRVNTFAPAASAPRCATRRYSPAAWRPVAGGAAMRRGAAQAAARDGAGQLRNTRFAVFLSRSYFSGHPRQ